MKVSEYAVKHPVVIGMLLIVLVVFGSISLASSNVEFISDLSMPSVTVTVIYPGASAEDIESDVVSILEDDFVTLPDFKSVQSQSMQSFCFVTITFRDGIDPYSRVSEVRDRVNQLTDKLPSNIQGIPSVSVGGSEMLPIFSFSVSGGKDTGAITKYIEDTLRPRITAIAGVSNVVVSGGSNLRVEVKLRLADLSSRNISALTVYQVLSASNVALPAGTGIFNGGGTSIRYDGQLTSIDDIKDLPVGNTESGVVIKLSDIADINLTYPEKDIIVSDGENPIIMVDVKKRSDGNTPQIVSKIKNILKESEAQTGGALTFNIISDDSRIVKSSTTTVIQSGLLGILMAIIIIFLFLSDIRATFIIAISIPISILFTLVAMKLLGITVNLMSLSGIVVALGMVVDGSIVIIEQVYRYYGKKNEMGNLLYSKKNAIFRGSKEVGPSIFASTATTVVVFVPIAFLSGIVGMVLKDIAITLIMSLSASFIAAVIIIPFLMELFLKEESITITKKPLVDKPFGFIQAKYKVALNFALSSAKFVTFTSAAILGATIFIATLLGVTFIPSTDNSDFYITADFPGNYTLEKTHEKMKAISKLVNENVSEVESTVFYSGAKEFFGGMEATQKSGYAHIVLVPVSKRKRGVHEIIKDMQTIISANIPDVKVKVSNGGFDRLLGFVSGGGGYGLTLVSEDLNMLYDSATKLSDFLKNDPDVVTVEMDTTFDTQTLVIDMAHQYMNSIGVTSYEAGMTSTILFQGLDVGRFKSATDNNRYDIHLSSDKAGKKITLADISDVKVVSSIGVPVSFSSISNIVQEQAVSQINHIDRAKTITVSASLVGEDAAGVNSRVNKWLAENKLPQGVSSRAGGIMELISDALPSVLIALAIAWFLVYTVMVLQFQRFRQPFIIMATIPFCLIGVILSLLVFRSTLSLLALLGIISLGGVVVNNGIILIDYINLIREQKAKDGEIETLESLRSSIIEASVSRLRPIFMTTLTTMFGVVPMSFAKGEGAEIYAPLGQAIAGGLLTSTLITLFVIPVLYFATEKRKFLKKSK